MSAEPLDPTKALPNESDEDFKKFLAYRNLPGKRSVLRAYQAASGKADALNAPGSWNKLPGLFHWKERARLWDAQNISQAIETEEPLGAIGSDDGLTWAQRYVQARASAWDSCKRLRRLLVALIERYETKPKTLNAFNLESVVRSAGNIGNLERQVIGLDILEDVLLKERDGRPVEQDEKSLENKSLEDLLKVREEAEKRLKALGVLVHPGSSGAAARQR